MLKIRRLATVLSFTRESHTWKDGLYIDGALGFWSSTDLAKSRSRRIQVWSCAIPFKIDMRLDSTTSEEHVNFQSDTTLASPNLAKSRRHEIGVYRSFVIVLKLGRPLRQQCCRSARQISKWHKHFNTQCRGVRDFMISCNETSYIPWLLSHQPLRPYLCDDKLFFFSMN